MSEVSEDGSPETEPAAVRYYEPARPYRSILYSLAAIAVGFGIDLAIGVHGAVTHLPGWVFFGGILVGIQALILYAARATHSLTVTEDQIGVGDEVLAVASVASLGGAPGEDVPVLGWPGGRPRGVRSIVVRLDDDRDVEIPTRFPDRLRAVLGVVDAAPRDDAPVRVATFDDLVEIPDIAERADTIFRVAGYDLPRIEFDVDGLETAAVVLVAADPPVAFAVVDLVDGHVHLAELAVLPGAMRRGIGTALVGAVCDWAVEHGHDLVTLVTYADVPWNGPFYRRLGFAELPFDELGPELRRRREQQTRLGLDAVGRRVVMRREL